MSCYCAVDHAKPWADMTEEEVKTFFHWHPTWCMTAQQASDWWAHVETAIRRDLAKYDDPATMGSDYDGKYVRCAGGYFVIAENERRDGAPTYAERRK